jgi:hypothetical protein
MTQKTRAARQSNAAAETEKRVAEATGAAPLSAAEVDAARKEGAKEDLKEVAKEQHRFLTDGNLVSTTDARQFTGMDDIMQYAGLLDLGADDFAQRIENGGPVPEEKVAGLLSLERAGRNRTPYVRAMMKRLKVDHPGEVTNAGPGYTNDVRPISEL